MYRSYCAVVTQHDVNWTWLTAREQIDLAHAFLQASLTKEARKAATESLLERTGLASCAELQAGTDIREEMGPAGLSGGQRRRLSLAVALAKKPSLLIADEPTSGLDAAAAATIMKVMRELATEERVAVLCTIHQPSASVFDCIRQLLILSKGRTAYLGQAAELMAYAASLGKPVPPGVSTAEHMLDLVNPDFASDASVDAVIHAWQEKAPPRLLPLAARSLPTEPVRATLTAQLWWLIDRHFFKLLPRDPMLVVIISALGAVDIIWNGIYYWNQVCAQTAGLDLDRMSPDA